MYSAFWGPDFTAAVRFECIISAFDHNHTTSQTPQKRYIGAFGAIERPFKVFVNAGTKNS